MHKKLYREQTEYILNIKCSLSCLVVSSGPASNEKNSDFWFLWRMMDAPSRNQSHPPCPPWAVQNGWSSDAPAGPLCNPLPDLQQLSLGCEPSQNLSYNHLQASGVYSKNDVAAFSTRSNSHPSMQYVCKVDQSIPDGLSPTIQERNKPPCSLPYNEAAQPMQHYSPPNAYQAVDPSSYSQHTYRSLLNQPPAQHPFPVSFSCVEPQLNHNQHLASDGGNSGSFVGFNDMLTSPSAPIQQQPLWSFAAFSKGELCVGLVINNIIGIRIKCSKLITIKMTSPTEVFICIFSGSINDFVPTASPLDHNLTPQVVEWTLNVINGSLQSHVKQNGTLGFSNIFVHMDI